jgi:hypothetical protein
LSADFGTGRFQRDYSPKTDRRTRPVMSHND